MVIFKFLGLIIIFCLPLHLGFSAAKSLKKRAESLSFLCKTMQELKERLRYEGSERNRLISDVFGSLDFLENNSESGIFEGLTDSDRVIFKEFLDEFGYGDKSTELKRIDLYISQLYKQRSQAEKDSQEQGKLYRTIGASAGLAVCILLI